jgi:hypothetical protein
MIAMEDAKEEETTTTNMGNMNERKIDKLDLKKIITDKRKVYMVSVHEA